MSKHISLNVTIALVVIGVLVIQGLAGCSLPRISRDGGDVGELEAPTIATVPEAQVTPPVAQQETAPEAATEAAPEAATEAATEAAPAPAVEPQQAQVADGAIVRVEPQSTQVNVGDTVIVDIVVANVTALSAADVQLQFDPALLEGVDGQTDEDGVQLEPGTFLTPDFVVINEIDNGAGLAHYAVTQVAPTPPVDGTGVLARVIFQAERDGTAVLTFPLANLASSTGQVIPVTTEPGQIVIGQPQVTPTPTFTLVPGQPTPTPTLTPQPPFTPTPTITPQPPPLTPQAPTPTPIPPVTKLPPNAIVGFCYRVQGGDSLYSIAHQFGVDVRRLGALNKLFSPHLIYVNQGLFIPDPWSTGTFGPKFYIAEQNQPLNDIAFQCNLPLEFLSDVNRIPEDAVLQAGHVILIPVPPPFPAPPPPIIRPHPPKPPYCCPPPLPPPCSGPPHC